MYPAGLNATELLGVSLQSCVFLLCMLHVDVGLQAQQNPHPCLSQVHWSSLRSQLLESSAIALFSRGKEKSSPPRGLKKFS